MDHEVNNVSRRSMLKRIGAGAAIAWSAPILTSLRVPAFAQASPACTTGFVCGEIPQACGEASCGCTFTTEGAECLSFVCEPDRPACTSSAECETRNGPGWRCQPAGTGCCGNTCIAPCGTTAEAGGTSNAG